MKEVHEVCFDNVNRIVTTPAYMKDNAKPDEVYKGIENMVQTIAKKLK